MMRDAQLRRIAARRHFYTIAAALFLVGPPAATLPLARALCAAWPDQAGPIGWACGALAGLWLGVVLGSAANYGRSPREGSPR